MTVDVGKIFVDGSGAGRLYLPKTIVDALQIQHKEQMKLEANEGALKAKPLNKT
jgi:hypothetical protein